MKKIFLIFCCLTSLLLATEPSQQVPLEKSNALILQNEVSSSEQPLLDSPFPHYFKRMLISLGLLIGLLILTAWSLKRLMRSREKGINDQRRIKILEKRALSSKSSLYLVEVDGEKTLIAESHLEIRPIQKISDTHLVNENRVDP